MRNLPKVIQGQDLNPDHQASRLPLILQNALKSKWNSWHIRTAIRLSVERLGEWNFPSNLISGTLLSALLSETIRHAGQQPDDIERCQRTAPHWLKTMLSPGLLPAGGLCVSMWAVVFFSGVSQEMKTFHWMIIPETWSHWENGLNRKVKPGKQPCLALIFIWCKESLNSYIMTGLFLFVSSTW